MSNERTRPCTPQIGEGRFRKSEQSFDAAETIREFAGKEADVGDAFVTLCVHAGIAASDVICCRLLGRYAREQDHQEAVNLLSSVQPDGRELGAALSALLEMKTRAGYGAEPVNADQRRRARRCANQLLNAARQRQVNL
jgi:hypothetical protein